MTDGVAGQVERPSRWQFSVRTVLLLMVAVGALSALYRVAPQLDVFVLGASPAVLCVRQRVQCRRRRCRPSLPAIAAVLPSFGMLYVVALGPAIVLGNRYPFWQPVLELIYAPLTWLYANTAFHEPLHRYADFWLGLR